jgi:hypothetical protein
VLFAAVGGVLLATPANAGILGPADVCTSPTTLVDTTGAGTGAIDLTGSSTGVSLGVNCVTSVALGDPTPAPTAPTAPAQPVSRMQTSTSTATSSPATTTTDATTGAADSVAAVADPISSNGSTISAAVASSTTELAHLSVLRSSNTVYPIKDGYRDSVRFAVRAMNSSGAIIPVVGSAVLTKATTTVETWHIDSTSKVLTWNGRVGKAVETGLYTLKVTAWSPDGSQMTQQSRVRVLSKHLVKHTMTVRSNVGARSVSADIPRTLLKAYSTGAITCRVVTVATVTGPAKLVFSNNGVARSVVLRNGTHTTTALPVPQGFSHVTISHDWSKGAAHLKSLKAIWTYTTLS